MGKRGPAPTPKAVLKLRGSWRGKDAPGDPVVDPREPEMPPDTSAEVATVWNQLVPLLLRMGVLTTIDGRALVRYCRWWLLWKVAEAVADIDEMAKCEVHLRKLEAAFGMDPASRSRITIPDKPETEKNDKKRFFA